MTTRTGSNHPVRQTSGGRRLHRVLRSVVGAVLLGALVVAAPVAAADGDNLRTIIADRTGTNCASTNEEGSHGSVGVGVAFDGANLLISCYSDNTVTAVSPADGSQVAIHVIADAESLGALAWDNGRGLLWACSAFSAVGTIDLATDTFTFRFSSDGCFDGLAYDGSDDTIWASGDVSGSAQHYDTAGISIASFPVDLGNCGSSGIAVGGPNLYMANNGCSEIYTVAKDFSTSTLFASFPARLEDMECDNLTFAGGPTPKAAIWSIDAYDNILNAWEIPDGSCAFGGGQTPAISVSKGASAASVAAGTSVAYTYTVTNTGLNAPLSAVTVSDDKCAPVSYTGGDASLDSILQSGEAWTYTCTVALNSTTTNVATATGQWREQTVSATASATVTVVPAPTPPTPTQAVLAATAAPQITLPPTSAVGPGDGRGAPGSGFILLALAALGLLAGVVVTPRLRPRR